MAAEPLRLTRREGEWPRIPGFRIEGVIGRGSTGIVYRAVQLAVEREVALKVLYEDLARKPKVVQRLQREARTTARLAHPHIVSAIDMGEVEGRWWFAMELVDGPSLRQLLRTEGRLRERDALRLFTPLAEALEHLWQHGVVHRDIKPANILLETRNNRSIGAGARLADLGLAFADDDPSLTNQGGTLGTPHYISPEQARDPSAVDVRTDLWSFGATLFHALCGRPPFQGDSVAEVLTAVLTARVPDPQRLEPSISRGMTLVLRKCLQRDPERRYQTPRELLLDLERLRERRAPHVNARGLDPLEARGVSWWRVAVGAGAGAALFVAFSLAWFQPWREPQPSVAESGPREPYPPIVEALQLAEGPDDDLAAGLALLAKLDGNLPEGYGPDWWAAQNQLAEELRSRVRALVRDKSEEVDARLAAGDPAGARSLLDRGLDWTLFSRTGFNREELPEDARDRLQAFVDETSGRIEGEIDRRVDGVRQAAENFHVTVVRPEFERLLAEKRYASALERIDLDRPELFEAAGIDVTGLPGERVDLALAGLNAWVTLDAEPRAEEAWRAEDRALREEVLEAARELERDLNSRALRTGAVDALRTRWDAALTRRGVAESERLSDVSDRARSEFERAAVRLALVEGERTERDLRAAFQLRDEGLGPALLGARRYAATAELWRALDGRLSQLDPAAAPYAASLRAEAELRLVEAERLRALLERAADGVARRDGERALLRTSRIESIRKPGTIESGPDPLGDGFWFVIEGRRTPLKLRDLRHDDLETLAGVADTESLAPRDRLVVAWLRYRDGRLTASDEALQSGPLPADAEGAALASELEARLGQAVLAQLDRGAGAWSAREFLDALDEDALDGGLETRDPAAAAAVAGVLLRSFPAAPEVALNTVELRRLESLTSAPDAADAESLLREAFPGAELSLDPDGRATLRFDFSRPTPGWSPGRWTQATDHLGNSEAVRGLRDLEQLPGPSLVLPLPDAALTSARVAVEWELSFPNGAPPTVLVLEAGGVQVALCGPSLPGEPGWVADTDGAAALVARIFRGERDGAGATLPANGARVRLEVDRLLGRVRLSVDGATVETSRRGVGGGSPARVELRAWGAVRARAVRVELPALPR